MKKSGQNIPADNNNINVNDQRTFFVFTTGVLNSNGFKGQTKKFKLAKGCNTQ